MEATIHCRATEILSRLGNKISPHEGRCAIAPTGEKYILLESTGVRKEGALTPRKNIHISQQDAEDAYILQLQTYASSKPGAVVYWRSFPQIEPIYHGWKIYSRLLISDKPDIGADREIVSSEQRHNNGL